MHVQAIRVVVQDRGRSPAYASFWTRPSDNESGLFAHRTGPIEITLYISELI